MSKQQTGLSKERAGLSKQQVGLSKQQRALRGTLEWSKGGVRRFGSNGVVGFDMEADSVTAEPFLITVDDGRGYVFEVHDWAGVVDALCRISNRGKTCFWYNLQYDFEGLAKFLPLDLGVRLYGGEVVEYGGVGIGYIEKKAFTIKRGGRMYRFFDLAQFYQMSLAKAMEKYLKHEQKGVFDASTMSLDKYERDERYKSEVVRYGLQDARGCRLLGELLVNGVRKYVNTGRFYSAASVSEDYFLQSGLRVPRMGLDVMKAFMRTYHGGRFEMVKRGVFEEGTIVDIKSAYPDAMRRMPILTDGYSIEWVEGLGEGAYGAYECDAWVPEDWYMGPIAVDGGVITYPVGKFSGVWLDRPTVEYLQKLGVEVDIKRGVEIVDEEAEPWLGKLIEPLFQGKEDPNVPHVLQYCYKIGLNGGYGKFIQLIDDVMVEEVLDPRELDDLDARDILLGLDKWYKRVRTGKFRMGRLFAPYYASYITSTVRNRLFDKSLEVGFENVVALHTDSVLLRGAYCGEVGKGLGDWEIEHVGGRKVSNAEIRISKCGFYSVDLGGGVKKVRARGISRNANIEDPMFTVKRRYGLSNAVRKDWDRLNVIENRVIRNDLNADRKRVWEQELTQDTFRQAVWVDSAPLTISV